MSSLKFKTGTRVTIVSDGSEDYSSYEGREAVVVGPSEASLYDYMVAVSDGLQPKVHVRESELQASE